MFILECWIQELNHQNLWMKIVKVYEIPSKIVSTINMEYSNTVAQVLTPDGDFMNFKKISAESYKEIY